MVVNETENSAWKNECEATWNNPSCWLMVSSLIRHFPDIFSHTAKLQVHSHKFLLSTYSGWHIIFIRSEHLTRDKRVAVHLHASGTFQLLTYWAAEWILLQTEEVGRRMRVRMREWRGHSALDWTYQEWDWKSGDAFADRNGLWMVWPWHGNSTAASRAVDNPMSLLLFCICTPGWGFFEGEQRFSPYLKKSSFPYTDTVAMRETTI